MLEHHFPKISEAQARWLVILAHVGLAAVYGAAVHHHLTLALDGWRGVERSGMINMVHQSLLWPHFFSHLPYALQMKALDFLWVLVGMESALVLLLLIPKHRLATIGLVAVATHLLVASAAVILANPSLAGVECHCTGIALLDFDQTWLIVVRNMLMIVVALACARWHVLRSRAQASALKNGGAR